jgi:hypothetical protein
MDTASEFLGMSNWNERNVGARISDVSTQDAYVSQANNQDAFILKCDPEPVTPGGAGSSPVHSANKINGLQQKCCNPFFFARRHGNIYGNT